MHQPEEQESLWDLKTFLIWGPWDALRDPVDWSRSEVLSDATCFFLSAHRVLYLKREARKMGLKVQEAAWRQWQERSFGAKSV